MRHALLIAAAIWIGAPVRSSGAADFVRIAPLPDTTPPGKPHFDDRGAKVGDQLPDLPLRMPDGQRTSFDKAWAGGPTLLLTSSYTCPKSRAAYPQAAALARRVSGRGVEVAIVYVIEAHPAGDPSPYSGTEEVTTENRRDRILCRQPTTLDERLKLANEFAARFGSGIPIFVDEMDNAAWHQLGGGPNMGVLVDRDGVVLARQGWFDAKSMGAAIDALIAATPAHAAPAKPDPAREREESTLRDLVGANNAVALKALLAQQPELEHRRLNTFGGSTLLQEAASRGALDVLRLLVARGEDVNSQSDSVPTPLHLAARQGNARVAQFLLDHGADVNARVRGHGPTPLQEALFNHHPEAAALLVKAGAKPNVYTAAAIGDLAFLRQAFLDDPTALARPDGVGRSALVYAAAAGRTDAVTLLLSLGARDLPANAGGDLEAAWWAVRDGNLPMARLLLEAGSDPNLFSAAIDEQMPIEMPRALLDDKADPNRVDDRGMRPLHWAAYADRRDVLQLLLDAGADVDGVTTQGSMLFCGPIVTAGDTPLHVAVENGRPATVEFLLAHTAKPDVKNEVGQTPLHEAAAARPEDAGPMIRALIAHHADVNATDTEGKTPLDYAERAASEGQLFPSTRASSVPELLREHGAAKGKPLP